MHLRSWALMESVGSALILALVAGGAACSSSSSGGGNGGTTVPTGGTTGTAGTAGTAGGSGTAGAAGTIGGGGGSTGNGGSKGSGGAGGTFVASCGALPACVSAAIGACPLAGDCSEAVTGAGNQLDTNLCYGVGTKVIWDITVDPDTATEAITITVTRNGATCYTLDGMSLASGVQNMTFRDVTGLALATFSSDPSTFPPTETITCTGGQPVVVTDFGNCGDPLSPEQNQCMGGRCVAP